MSPGVVNSLGTPRGGMTDPGSRTRMNQDPVSRTRDLHGAIGGATVGKKSKMPHEML